MDNVNVIEGGSQSSPIHEGHGISSNIPKGMVKLQPLANKEPYWAASFTGYQKGPPPT